MSLTDEGRRLVDEARAAYGPTESDRERVQTALAARVAAATAVAAAVSSSGSAAGSVASVAAAKGVIVGIVAVTAIGAASVGYWGARHRGGAPPRPAANSPVVRDRAPARQAPTVDDAPPPSAVAAPEADPPPPARRAKPAARGPRPLAAAPAPGPDVAGEVALLARAHKALADGDLQRCLQLLNEHERVFPSGVLSEERAAARIIALCGLGHVAAARREIAAFLSKAPVSPFAERVRHACGAAWPPPVPPRR